MQPETRFKIKVLKDLSSMDVFAIKIQQVSTHGDPDIILCVKGNYVALELKTLTGRASALQIYKLDQIKRNGGYSFIVDPNSWPSIRHFISELDETKAKEIPTCLKLPSVI